MFKLKTYFLLIFFNFFNHIKAVQPPIELISFRTNPKLFIQKYFNDALTSIEKIDSNTIFEILNKENLDYNFSIKILKKRHKILAYSYIIELKNDEDDSTIEQICIIQKPTIIYPNHNDNESYTIEDIYIIDTLNCLFLPRFQHKAIIDSNVLKYQYYISLFSGNELGEKGGWAGGIPLKTSQHFENIIEKVEPQNFHLFLTSPNIYIQLQAAHYFKKNKKLFKNFTHLIMPLYQQIANDKINKIVYHYGGCIQPNSKIFTPKEYLKR